MERYTAKTIHILKINLKIMTTGRVNPTLAGARLALSFKYEADGAW